ncbi:protein pbn1 [Cordyceps fumosorosea ARSEF 2679]|uniref:Protein PBN1 n=1 Tax=Cordyceps fumosorosea (strain ARSEF 2679) TaxID=1081104 RepID=A0A167RSC6_CORFA|nr:protein pbn1 [Cordyceps fumosorosea ARSEF 2679]OAA58891.1 protein pbn1 [Cordyceps fumosorosea ARSEF 2679]
MKERITFIHPPGGELDPKDFDVQPTGLLGPTINTMREDRFTIPINEIPANFASVLRDFSSLQVRWASPRQQNTISPFSSRISPGFHVSYTSAKQTDVDPSKLCSLLQAFGPVGCESREAFTEHERKSRETTTGLYFHQHIEALDGFMAYFSTTFCTKLDPECEARVRGLDTAASLDITYSAEEQAVKVTAFWPLRSQSLVAVAADNRRTEVGIMGLDEPANMKPHELGVSGTLTVLREHTKPSAVFFAFPARHRASPASFSSRFLSPTGLHPTMQLGFDSNKPPVDGDSCKMYTYLTLPRTIFADRYQLADDLFLASKNLTAAPYSSLPVDLEAPEYTTSVWGSTVLLQLAPPAMRAFPDAWTAEVPLHLRYLRPSETGIEDIEVPFPAVFWACGPVKSADFTKSPFDRIHLGYDDLFEDGTVFWHVYPRGHGGNRVMESRLTSSISVPVLNASASGWVETGTTVAISIGFAWILWKLLSAVLQFGYKSNATDAPASSSAAAKKDDKKKKQ